MPTYARPESVPSFLDMMRNTLPNLERVGVNILGVKDVIDYSEEAANRLSGIEGGWGDQGDALRHLILSAELHRTHPMLAPMLLYGHEWGTGMLEGQSSEDRDMDLYNNKLGKTIGQRATSRADVERMALETLPQARVIREFVPGGAQQFSGR